MGKGLKIVLVIFTLLFLLGAVTGYDIYREVNHQDCGLGEGEARKRIERDLARRALDSEFLEYESSQGSCILFFQYRDTSSHYSYGSSRFCVG